MLEIFSKLVYITYCCLLTPFAHDYIVSVYLSTCYTESLGRDTKGVAGDNRNEGCVVEGNKESI